MMRLRMLLSRSCGSHVNSNFERMVLSYNLFCIHALYINGGSHGNGCCRKRIRKWTI